MWYKITPIDTLFFRDGKPFTMGADTWARTIFPPNPSTVYGAIRTWLIYQKGGLEEFLNGKLKRELGTSKPEEKGTLQIKGPLLIKNGEVFFSIPYDLLFKLFNESDKRLFKLSLSSAGNFYSDYRMDKILIWRKKEILEQSDDGFISKIYLENYLKSKDGLGIVDKNELYIEEKKIGIKRNRTTLSSEESFLYRVSMIRLESEVSILIKIEGVSNLPESGILNLGGEGKIARIEKVEDTILKDLEISLTGEVFKVYLATPAIFKKGWLPSWIDEKTLKGTKNDVKVKLLACAIGKPVRIGGWDLANEKPKPMYKAVPAGSVYYFEVENGDIEKIKSAFHFQNISDIYPEEGYGLSFCGVVEYERK